MPNKSTEPSRSVTFSNAAFLSVEHGVYAAIGLLLAVVGVVALIHVATQVASDVLNWDESGRIYRNVDALLFVLMLAEILHTVRVSIRSGNLNAEPFLVVGLIASIRRVLVITLASSNTQQQGGEHSAPFQNSMIELGVLAGLILTMVTSIYIIRRAAQVKQAMGEAEEDESSPSASTP